MLPTRSSVTPSPCRITTRSGNAAPPCETRYAGPVDGVREDRGRRSRGPDVRPRGTRRGVRVERRSRTRLLDRRQPRRELLGERHRDLVDVRLRPLGVAHLHIEARTLLLTRLRLRGDRERRLEREARAVRRLEVQDTFAVAPCVLVSDPSTGSGSQLGGVEHEPRPVDVTFTVRTSSGMPCRIVGNGSLVTVICAVCGSTLIAARTTTLPRLNGPATAGHHDRQPERGALIRAREEHLATLHPKWVRARARRDRRVPDQTARATRALRMPAVRGTVRRP